MAKQREITFQKYLKNAFEKRCLKNPSYSLRAFARDLDVPAANLSNALNGTRGFSQETIEKISRKLSLSYEETQFLKSLCLKDFSKSKKNKEDAVQKIKEAFLYQVQLSDQKVNLISDWYHLAIMALLDTKDFDSDHEWIAERLGLHRKVIDQAIERLISIDAIKKVNGLYQTTGHFFVDPKDIPSRAVREFHRQILAKADEALEMQDVQNREFATVLMNLDKNKLKAAKEKIKKFREEFVEEFTPDKESAVQHQEVYSISLQLFQITKNRNDLNKGRKNETI